MKIALVGNPNSGKTTVFNGLTGSNQYVGNWPGVTVERKEGKYKADKSIFIQDLPGIYSLSPYSPEEIVSRDYLINDKPDVIVNIVDATNLERNLYLTTQIMDLGMPMVIALNMMDVVEKQHDYIDVKLLSEMIGCPVVPCSALKKQGIQDIVVAAKQVAKKPNQITWSKSVTKAINEVANIIDTPSTFVAVRVLANDKMMIEDVDSKKLEEVVKLRTPIEKEYDDDIESIVTTERYDWIEKLAAVVIKRSKKSETMSDKIDRIVTNRWLALPIFALVMWLVYYISISTIGTMGTDWVNDVLFGEWVPNFATNLLESLNASEWVVALVVDGIIGGVGAVLGFLPQMLVLFLCLAILEDCGYMSRIAFIMDRIFRKFGLSGKSFIPMLVSMGCGVPGVLASRTIENEDDRRMTIMTTTFIPCGAKLPIIALIAGALFDESAWISTSAYFLGVAAILCSGIILKKTKYFSSEAAPFVMELPSYHMPIVGNVLRQVADRGWAFVKKAGTIIFVSSVVIWFLGAFNFSFEMVDTSDSILAAIGNVVAPIFAPLGWGFWQATVATVTGLIAKENVVATIGVLYGMAEVSEDGVEIWGQVAQSFTALSGYSFLAFNLLCAPCFAAIGAIKREMMSAKWTWFAIGYQTVLAYLVAFVIFQLGTLITGGSFTIGAILAITVLLVFLFLLFRPNTSDKKKV